MKDTLKKDESDNYCVCKNNKDGELDNFLNSLRNINLDCLNKTHSNIGKTLNQNLDELFNISDPDKYKLKSIGIFVNSDCSKYYEIYYRKF